MLVLVENVLQISTTNYTLEQSTSGNLAGPNSPYADGYYIKFLSAVPNGKAVTVQYITPPPPPTSNPTNIVKEH